MPALVPIQNLRSGTSSKRPSALGLALGQIAINYNESDPAIYIRGDADALIKISPTFVGSTAPNVTPASGGTSGNSKGETWLDTSTSPAGLKIWNGTTWVSSYALASGTTILSPTLSGIPTAPTAPVGTNTTQIATTEFVNAEIANDAPTKTGVNASGTWNISISGNAATATALQTSRTITLAGDLSGSVGFDGTSNVTLTGTVAPNSVALGTDTVGDYVATAAAVGNGITATASGEGSTLTISSNATSSGTASTLVFRDASGNFSAGTITAALNGNANTATTATRWATPRTVTLSGDVSGSVSIDGSANVTIATSVVAASGATTASRWTTARSFVYTGDVTASGLVDGSEDETFTTTIANGAVTPAKLDRPYASAAFAYFCGAF